MTTREEVEALIRDCGPIYGTDGTLDALMAEFDALTGQRDRARDVAVKLEQELAEVDLRADGLRAYVARLQAELDDETEVPTPDLPSIEDVRYFAECGFLPASSVSGANGISACLAEIDRLTVIVADQDADILELQADVARADVAAIEAGRLTDEETDVLLAARVLGAAEIAGFGGRSAEALHAMARAARAYVRSLEER